MLVGMRTQNQVLLGMSYKTHAMQLISKKGLVLFGLRSQSCVLFDMNVDCPVLDFPYSSFGPNSTRLFYGTPRRLRKTHHTARDFEGASQTLKKKKLQAVLEHVKNLA